MLAIGGGPPAKGARKPEPAKAQGESTGKSAGTKGTAGGTAGSNAVSLLGQPASVT